MCKDKKISILNAKNDVKIPMMEEVTHVYFVPGMAADVSIFEYINLPNDKYQVHTIPWKIPIKDENIQVYAKRMCKEVFHENCVLIGVSFGGIVAQEMSRFLDVKKLIIISSIKSKHELPSRLKVMGKIKAYKILPTFIISKIDNWEKLAFGDFAKKRAVMYQRYLSVNDKNYLDWSIKNIVCWDQEEVIEGIVHIHGDKDIIFPIQNIENCIKVKNGTHVMIVNRAKWFNAHLPEIIEE
ncbi:alpha/beta hydrolase [Aquimarina addita]|uniref:Alpha/beta hydrolase n=1 Tax=Aquimarina addita TaxID=870485 RepID=A0ABP6UPU4_9FLAO